MARHLEYSIRTLRLILISSLLLSLSFSQTHAQDSKQYQIHIQFKHGSRVKKAYKEVEKPELGGKLGGHVVIRIDSQVCSFRHDKGTGVHIFPKRKKQKYTGHFECVAVQEWETEIEGYSFTSIAVPISAKQWENLHQIYNCYQESSPHDYAFFGMRCAASCRKILSQTQILPKRSRCRSILSSFYPRMLRKRLEKWAKAHNFTITKRIGNDRRVWEKD